MPVGGNSDDVVTEDCIMVGSPHRVEFSKAGRRKSKPGSKAESHDGERNGDSDSDYEEEAGDDGDAQSDSLDDNPVLKMRSRMSAVKSRRRSSRSVQVRLSSTAAFPLSRSIWTTMPSPSPFPNNPVLALTRRPDIQLAAVYLANDPQPVFLCSAFENKRPESPVGRRVLKYLNVANASCPQGRAKSPQQPSSSKRPVQRKKRVRSSPSPGPPSVKRPKNQQALSPSRPQTSSHLQPQTIQNSGQGSGQGSDQVTDQGGDQVSGESPFVDRRAPQKSNPSAGPSSSNPANHTPAQSCQPGHNHFNATQDSSVSNGNIQPSPRPTDHQPCPRPGVPHALEDENSPCASEVPINPNIPAAGDELDNSECEVQNPQQEKTPIQTKNDLQPHATQSSVAEEEEVLTQQAAERADEQQLTHQEKQLSNTNKHWSKDNPEIHEHTAGLGPKTKELPTQSNETQAPPTPGLATHKRSRPTAPQNAEQSSAVGQRPSFDSRKRKVNAARKAPGSDKADFARIKQLKASDKAKSARIKQLEAQVADFQTMEVAKRKVELEKIDLLGKLTHLEDVMENLREAEEAAEARANLLKNLVEEKDALILTQQKDSQALKDQVQQLEAELAEQAAQFDTDQEAWSQSQMKIIEQAESKKRALATEINELKQALAAERVKVEEAKAKQVQQTSSMDAVLKEFDSKRKGWAEYHAETSSMMNSLNEENEKFARVMREARQESDENIEELQQRLHFATKKLAYIHETYEAPPEETWHLFGIGSAPDQAGPAEGEGQGHNGQNAAEDEGPAM